MGVHGRGVEARSGSLAGVPARPALAALVLLTAACAVPVDTAAPMTTSTTVATTTATAAPPPPVPIALRVERLVDDAATEGFEAAVTAVLTDERGWQQVGFAFTFAADAPYTVVLAEGPEVDARCLPYDTFGRFSCQLGPVVALNADRWRLATDTWPGTLDEYRTMLVNHEVGHLLGQHHPAVPCPAPGEPAPVMAQQSSGLDGCAPNPWPLPWELACAARHVEPLAPPYEESPRSACGP